MAWFASILFLILGCSLPRERIEIREIDARGQLFSAVDDPKTDQKNAMWWNDFSDENLDRLIHKALEQNVSVETQKERLKQVIHREGVSTAQLWPSLSWSLSQNRREGSSGAAGLSFSKTLGETYTSSLEMAYQVDFFGALRNQSLSAELEVKRSIEELKETLTNVAKGVTENYFTIVAFRQKIKLLRNAINLDKKYLTLIETRYNLGTSSAGDLYQSREQLLSSESSLVMMEQSHEEALNRLLGQVGDSGDHRKLVIKEEFPSMIKAIPVSVSASLFKRRPDIRKQLYAVMAADAGVASALADRFPRFRISASANRTSRESVSDLFTPQNLLWNFIAGISAPLFDGGSLKANYEAKKSVLQERLSRYQHTVYDAFRDVSEGLSLIRQQDRLIGILKKQFASNRRSLNYSSEQFMKGIIGYSVILPILQRNYQIQRTLIDQTMKMLMMRVRIYCSVGGRMDFAVAPPLDHPLTEEEVKKP